MNLRPAASLSFRPALMADLARYGVRFDSEGVQPPANPKPEPKTEPKIEPKTEPKADPAADATAALQAELERLRKEREAFGDATPAEIAELRKAKAEAERLRLEAEKAKAREEEEKLRRAGDFDTLKARMAEEHQKELTAAEQRAKDLQEIANRLQNQVKATAVTAAFAGSAFITENTVLSPSLAKKLYEDHVDIEDDAVVVYDAPRGAAKRSPIVDARGNAMAFDEAIKRVIEADSERDRILRSKQKAGSGQPHAGVKAPAARDEPTGLARIRLGLEQLRKQPSR